MRVDSPKGESATRAELARQWLAESWLHGVLPGDFFSGLEHLQCLDLRPMPPKLSHLSTTDTAALWRTLLGLCWARGRTLDEQVAAELGVCKVRGAVMLRRCLMYVVDMTSSS
jgi:hypothetical protein